MRFLFACGGTAGHINPALAVAGRLKELNPDSEFLFIGAEGKMETELVPRAGFDIIPVEISNISREKTLEGAAHNLQTVRYASKAIVRCRKIIREFAPDAVIGTGGYVCFPVITAASELRVPTLIHESNAVPGLTTKLLSRLADRILVGLEGSEKFYSNPEKVVYTGTPVRGSFSTISSEEAKAELGVTDRPLVASVWGSLGSGHMNSVITDMIPKLKDNSDIHLIHSIGRDYYEGFMSNLNDICPDYNVNGNISVNKYIYNIDTVLSAADLVICRAGASTLAELTYLGKPAVIVPSPNVAENHQEKNARVIERGGGARVLLEKEFDADSLLGVIRELVSSSPTLEEMAESMKKMSVSNSCDLICNEILKQVGR